MTEFSTANFWKLDKFVWGSIETFGVMQLQDFLIVRVAIGHSENIGFMQLQDFLIVCVAIGHSENIRDTFLYFACIVIAPSHQPFPVSAHFQKLLTR